LTLVELQDMIRAIYGAKDARRGVDGTGYPDKLGRDQIAVTARIVAVADAFDAMTSHRPYRPAMPAQLAFLEILSKAGTHFDPACVQAFLRLRAKVETVLNQT